jgi:hypothetical protein
MPALKGSVGRLQRRALSRLCSPCFRPSHGLSSQGRGANAFREPLQFIVMSVIDVIGGTFPHINRVFYMTVNCGRILDARFVFHPRGLSSIIY